MIKTDGVVPKSKYEIESEMDRLLDDDGGFSSEENKRHREYMQRSMSAMEKSLRTAERKVQERSKRSVQENALLIAECNRLRKEAVTYRQKCDELEGRLAETQRKLRQFVSQPSSMFGTMEGLVGSTASVTSNQADEEVVAREETVSSELVPLESAPGASPMHRTSSSELQGRPSSVNGASAKTPPSRLPLAKGSIRKQSLGRPNTAGGSSGAERAGSRSPSWLVARQKQRLNPTASHNALYNAAEDPSGHRQSQGGAVIPGSCSAGQSRQTEVTGVQQAALVEKLLQSLDEANREISMQRSEIHKLRSQLNLELTNSAAGTLATLAPH